MTDLLRVSYGVSTRMIVVACVVAPSLYAIAPRYLVLAASPDQLKLIALVTPLTAEAGPEMVMLPASVEPRAHVNKV